MPITIVATHTSFQPKLKEDDVSETDRAKGKQTLKGEWGDVTDTSGKDIIPVLEGTLYTRFDAMNTFTCTVPHTASMLLYSSILADTLMIHLLRVIIYYQDV